MVAGCDGELVRAWREEEVEGVVVGGGVGDGDGVDDPLDVGDVAGGDGVR